MKGFRHFFRHRAKSSRPCFCRFRLGFRFGGVVALRGSAGRVSRGEHVSPFAATAVSKRHEHQQAVEHPAGALTSSPSTPRASTLGHPSSESRAPAEACLRIQGQSKPALFSPRGRVTQSAADIPIQTNVSRVVLLARGCAGHHSPDPGDVSVG